MRKKEFKSLAFKMANIKCIRNMSTKIVSCLNHSKVMKLKAYHQITRKRRIKDFFSLGSGCLFKWKEEYNKLDLSGLIHPSGDRSPGSS